MFNEAIYINDNWVAPYQEESEKVFCVVQMMNFLQISKDCFFFFVN